MPITVQNWLYGNFESSFPVTHDDIIMQPGAYLVVTKDKRLFSEKYPSISCVCQPEAWLSLDNSKDTLCLWNSRGGRCETIVYNAGWFDRWTDQSIERVSLHHDPASRGAWVLAERPSPGQPNGSVPFRAAEKPGLEIGPERFTPNGDGHDDLLSIRLTLPATYTAAISVYGFNGRKYVDVPTLSPPPYYWNGKTSANTLAPTGPFFVVATFKNGSQTVMIRKKGILWR
jgi:hypothetical protein